MSDILRSGQRVRAEVSGSGVEVRSLLGSGGQGEVYLARFGNTDLALKWYYPDWATPAQRSALDALVRKGPPSQLFLWPIDLASAPGVPGFGYLMPLREQRFRSGNDLAKRRIEPSFRAVTTAAIYLADAFLQLHAKGLAYRDISFGNLFLDPSTGDVLICDVDNVGIDGQPHNEVGGTMRFMAPEIVRGEVGPSTQTDQFSLAVLLFYMFLMTHPLEGQREANCPCLSLPAQLDLYGTRPVSIVDPHDRSNRPVPGQHDNFLKLWPLYPSFLKRLFERSFTEGLRNRAARVKESEWRSALLQLRDAIIYCPRCEAENFLEVPFDKGGPVAAPSCWACKRPVPPPMCLRLGQHVVALNHDARLFAHHLDERQAIRFSTPLAEVSQHPRDPSVWGLKNLSSSTWSSRNSAGQVVEVPTGRSVRLEPGTIVSFGKGEGEVYFPGASTV